MQWLKRRGKSFWFDTRFNFLKHTHLEERYDSEVQRTLCGSSVNQRSDYSDCIEVATQIRNTMRWLDGLDRAFGDDEILRSQLQRMENIIKNS